MSTKISQLTSAVDVTANDLIQIVDVEDGVMAPSGTNKKATASLLANQLVPLINAGAIDGSKISNSSITPAKLSTGGPSWNSSGTLSVTQVSVNNPSGDSSIEIGGSGSVYIDLKKPNSDDSDMRIGVDSTNTSIENQVPFYINPNSNQIVSIAAGGGNVGIGTFTPDARLNVEDNSASDAVRITQTGSGNALVVEDSTNPDATPFVVNNQGQVLIGDTTSRTGPYGYQRGLQLTNQGTQLTAAINNQYGEGIAFAKSRGTPSSPHTIVQLGDALGSIAFTGSDGSDYVLGSQIASFVDAVPGSGDMPSCLAFATSSDGTTNAAERMRITSSGNVGIGTSSPSYQLQLSTDSAAKPSTSTWTVSSDERLKENIEAADLDICYNAVKSIPLKRYKWKDEIYSAEQVADRSKIGWIAQDVQAVFPKAVGQHKFVYNQVKDEEGNIVSEDSIDDCLSLNSDQLYAALFGAVQKLMGEVESLQDRIAELESAP